MTNNNQCYGVYNNDAGRGPGYVNSCIHSNSTEVSGGNTVWYNYPLASAGTIVNANTTEYQSNNALATESICPKGWTLPNRAQLLTIGPSSGSTTYVSIFSPVLGGDYFNGKLINNGSTKEGRWWGSEGDGPARSRLRYEQGTNLSTGGTPRNGGIYIRCVQAS